MRKKRGSVKAVKARARSKASPSGRKSAGRQKSMLSGANSDARSEERLVQSGGVLTRELKAFRFAGVSLAGGKTEKTAIALLEYYPDQKRVFLRSLRDRLRTREDEQETRSGDLVLHHILTEEETDLESIAFDAPLQLPKCLRCELECPGYEKCREPEIKWMWERHARRAKLKRPNKLFTPYTERCAEMYIANELEEPFHPSHALGANAAPLAARAHFIRRRLSSTLLEVFPKLSLWRIGTALKIPKSHLRFHRHAVDSDEARLYILKTLIEKEIAFIYQQDLKLMVDNHHAFDAFVCALTGFLKHRGQVEKPPAGFPRSEQWIEIPKEKIHWF